MTGRAAALLRAGLALVLWVAAAQAFAAATPKTTRFAAAGHGFIEVAIPPGWLSTVRQPFAGSLQATPTLGFWPLHGKPFEVTLTPVLLPPDGASAPLPALRERVEGYAKELKGHAVEETLDLVRFEGRSGAPGFYFSATDKAPGPGDYKFVTQGALKVGDFMVTFTILTNDGQREIVRQALEMLKGAAQVR